MTDITDDQVNELLQEAEERLSGLRGQSPVTSTSPAVSTRAPGINPQGAATQATRHDNSVAAATKANSGQISPSDGVRTEKLFMRIAQRKLGGAESSHKKDNAGSNWFNMPKTDMTPQFKRDWQLLRMRGLLDPKNQKKALHKEAPQYSQVGEIIEGATDFHSSRLTKRERKQTIMEEMMSAHDKGKMATKYAGIQKHKSSGKKAFYKKLVEQRRRRN